MEFGKDGCYVRVLVRYYGVEVANNGVYHFAERPMTSPYSPVQTKPEVASDRAGMTWKIKDEKEGSQCVHLSKCQIPSEMTAQKGRHAPRYPGSAVTSNFLSCDAAEEKKIGSEWKKRAEGRWPP